MAADLAPLAVQADPGELDIEFPQGAGQALAGLRAEPPELSPLPDARLQRGQFSGDFLGQGAVGAEVHRPLAAADPHRKAEVRSQPPAPVPAPARDDRPSARERIPLGEEELVRPLPGSG